MRPEARLDSAVFQLTPTRTRCDLILIANGRKEKIASGLLNPFLAHLKAAQDQIAKGGYSITLEPDPEIDAPWFTRGTVERFVRFVSTPEILERVTTIESEILQIEDAIAIQSNDSLGLRSVDDHQGKSGECIEGIKSSYDPDADKAIVLYKPGSQPNLPTQNETTTQEENSKVQLLKVLETRKTVLRKEQAMAFARAVAAGFDVDNLAYLITFAECFGASRLMKACMQFIELWKRKHETGQWIEVEPEAMSTRSEFPPFNATGIVFMGDNGDVNTEDAAKDQKAVHPGAPYHAAYPPWAMHPQSGSAGYPPYPMQGMPYYPGMSPYYPPPYPPMEDPRFHHSERKASRKHSAGSKDSETLDDGSDQSGSERESSHGHKSHKKGKRSGKKKHSIVVKRHGSSESESQSSSAVESEDSDDSHTKSRARKHKSSSSKKKEGRKNTVEFGDEYTKDETYSGQDAEQGNWNAFQSFLLRAEEKTKANDSDLFSGEKEPSLRRKEKRSEADPILLAERDSGAVHERNAIGFDSANGRSRSRQLLSNDELMMSGGGRGFMEGDLKEIEAGGGGYRRGTADDLMVYGQEKPMDGRNSLDPLAETQYRRPAQMDKNMQSVTDESFMIPLRSGSQDNVGPESRTAIDIDIELPSSVQKMSDTQTGSQLYYEPDELMPDRGFEDVSIGYDPAMDYDSQMPVQTTIKLEDTNGEDVSPSIKEETRKAEKDKKLRNSQDGSDKRRKESLVRRLSSSKTAPLTEAQKRAQNLRAYKADLQKMKKEQEEEQMKRLERLKLERQKRIAARSSSTSGTNSTSTPQETKAKPAPKISPSSYKGSKFSDSEPASSSPLRKLPGRTTPGSDPQKAAKTSRSSDSTNGLSKSVSSLPELKKEKSSTTEASIERLKKLSEPKHHPAADRASNPKQVTTDHARKKSTPEESQTKKLSAIVQLDQSKTATLPELKVKSTEAPVAVQNKTATKETKQEIPRAKVTPALEAVDGKRADDKGSRVSNSDDSVVVEKTVVMLENQVVSTPVILAPGKTVKYESYSDDRKVNPGLEPEYSAIRAPPSPVIINEAENPTVCTTDDQLNSHEVVLEYPKDEPQKPTAAPVEKPYQAPFARATSLEDAAARIPASPLSLPVHESETHMRTDSIRAQVPVPADVVSVEETYEQGEKYRSKESKGFRKLLKFGRKSHTSTSAEGNTDSDASSVDETTTGAASSNDGSMLKNLISQDDPQSGGAQSKASRSFSLLSPFRSKQKVIVL